MSSISLNGNRASSLMALEDNKKNSEWAYYYDSGALYRIEPREGFIGNGGEIDFYDRKTKSWVEVTNAVMKLDIIQMLQGSGHQISKEFLSKLIERMNMNSINGSCIPSLLGFKDGKKNREWLYYYD